MTTFNFNIKSFKEKFDDLHFKDQIIDIDIPDIYESVQMLSTLALSVKDLIKFDSVYINTQLDAMNFKYISQSLKELKEAIESSSSEEQKEIFEAAIRDVETSFYQKKDVLTELLYNLDYAISTKANNIEKINLKRKVDEASSLDNTGAIKKQLNDNEEALKVYRDDLNAVNDAIDKLQGDGILSQIFDILPTPQEISKAISDPTKLNVALLALGVLQKIFNKVDRATLFAKLSNARDILTKNVEDYSKLVIALNAEYEKLLKRASGFEKVLAKDGVRIEFLSLMSTFVDDLRNSLNSWVNIGDLAGESNELESMRVKQKAFFEQLTRI